ncbi:Homeodomain-related protein [Cordyceps fumosorosea ARSEF 2679]|uniref:DNA-binding protein RAP1 n=1 Tax=Cordyceps fumosorosea (strain ARSEF 2679) TaxID=1081104 RepID=A0A167WIG9_CORFA|nr:Homeodomain-related protein [Cordyceps fumosorosea ARSEF 2679]OAA63831.1 Homeodomain-related protein [Cordyceps fumosorosea ARSEF 2679]
MPGGIAYNGIPVQNGGQIFAGLKFWVAHRVPTRPTILDHIERNSGIVVPLEKDADYLIADHARKDAPSGAISWKFITESVENGVAQLLDRYRIGHAPAGPREIASNRPIKGGRAPFTAADDAALASFLLAQGNRNLTGNEIYKLFETMHPNHPWQSWRNRYVKKLRLLPIESLQHLAAQATDEPEILAIEGASADQELPDPSDLMLQRKGHKIQQENARHRANDRATRASAAAAAQPAVAGPSLQPTTREQEEITPAEARDRFHEDLQMFCEEAGVEIAPMQQVAGAPLELWDLFRVVIKEQLSSEGIDWLNVADVLGYGWLDPYLAAEALEECYEDNLAEFLAIGQDLLRDDEEERREEENHSDTAAAADELDPPPPSTPPARFLPPKRALDADGELDLPTPAKRRRLHIPPEIPSTPDVNRHQPTTAGARDEMTPVPLRTQESAVDMTPSQQLRSEFSEHAQTSPIPLRTNSVARNRQIGGADGSSPSGSGTAGAKRRTLPAGFRPQPPPPIPDHESSFPRALPRTQPPPPPTRRRPAQAIPRRLSRDRELSELIQHYESLGYSYKVVVEGLRRTSVTPGLATVVMQSLRDGHGVPANQEGIWTDRDDAALRLVVAAVGGVNLDDEHHDHSSSKEAVKERRKAHRARGRLLDKHGQEGVAVRIQYLRASDRLAE